MEYTYEVYRNIIRRSIIVAGQDIAQSTGLVNPLRIPASLVGNSKGRLK